MLGSRTLQAAVAIVSAISCSSYASSQTVTPAEATSEDWTLAKNGATTAAYVQFDSGFGIIVRCTEERLEALIAGLPDAPEGRTRQLGLAIGSPPESPETWYVGRDRGVVVSTFPARFARWVREGGSLNVSVPGGAEGGRNLRYVVDLPPSPTAIDEVLAACGRPPVDPRDTEIDAAGVSAGLTWARPPRPSYPTRRVYEWGFASLTCLSQPNGSLTQCQVEAEHPQRGGFGGAALQSVRDARLRGLEDGPVPQRVVAFTVRFQMGGPGGDGISFETPTRLRSTN